MLFVFIGIISTIRILVSVIAVIDLETLTIRKAHENLLKREFSAVELSEAYLKSIEEKNSSIHAYLEVFNDVILQAETADKQIKEGNTHPLVGIPLAVKDNILIEGRYAGAGSRILESHIASYDATVVKKLKESGAVLLGRTNQDEFAMGSSTENSAFGVTRNPHDETRVPGGSSGGSAAAVVMDGALAALGSDTGGSIRQPASFCGLVGLKPTYGIVSRYGLIAMGSSLDQVGPMARTVEDTEIVFDAIRGNDPMDSTSLPDDFYSCKEKKGKLTIGVPTDFTEQEGIDEDVRKNFKSSLEKLKSLGYTIQEISLPYIKYSLAVYHILMPAEASTNLARFDGVRYGLHKSGEDLLDDYFQTRGEGFGREVRRRIVLGTYILSAGYYDAYYNKAVAVRNLITEDLKKVFNNSSKGGVDVIAMPTTPTPAFKIGEKTKDPLAMYLADIFTITANITGIPALTVPSGYAEREGKNMPLGMQFLGAWGSERTLFNLGKEFQEVIL